MISGADRPLAPLGRRVAEISAADQYGPYTVLSALDTNGPTPHAGQFYMLQTEIGWGGGDGGRPYLPRALSYARVSPSDDGLILEFLLEAVGPGTDRLADTRAGERLLIAGPFGNGFEVAGEHSLLVAGGVGLAPIVALSDQLESCRAFVGMRSASHAAVLDRYFDDGFAALTTEDGTAGARGYITELLTPALAEPGARVFACGPPAMLEAVRALCEEHEIPSQLAMESGMACGFGACFGCVVPTKHGYVRLCVDGPVLDGRDVETALVPGAGH